MKRLIITADDFGIHADANKAIIELFTKGALSSVSLMTNCGKSSAEAIELANLYNIPCGLHFNLTVNNPNFKSRGDFERKYVLGQISKQYIRQELEKQYEALTAKAIKPTHLDSHQHIHNWPGIFKIVARFAKEKGLPLRIPEEKPIYNPYQQIRLGDLKQLIRKYIFLIFSKINRLQAKLMKIKTNQKLVSLFALWPRPEVFFERHLELLLNNVADSTEYMCHPSVASAGLEQLTAIAEVSVQEYGLMTKESFLAMIEKSKIQLINYGEL